MGGDLGVSTPGGETNAAAVAGNFKTADGVIGVLFAFDRTNHHAIPAIIAGNAGVEALKRQLGAHAFRLIGTLERATLNHPATGIFFLLGAFRGLFLLRDA